MRHFEMGTRTFKGWTKPGPLIDPAGDAALLEAGESLDAISGDYRLFQLSDGHRFSTDDILTAWYGTTWCPRADRVLDLGSGIGSVATVAAWRLPGARLETVEAQSESVRLARKSVRRNRLENRVTIREGDFRQFTPAEPFDLVLGSPPYFPLEAGVHGDHPQKIACRFEARGDVRDYARAAARALAPGGVFAFCFPIRPETQLDRAREAVTEAGLSLLRMRPVVFREGEEPMLGLFAACRASDLPEAVRGRSWTEPPLVIRALNGAVHPEYQAVKLAIGFPP